MVVVWLADGGGVVDWRWWWCGWLVVVMWLADDGGVGGVRLLMVELALVLSWWFVIVVRWMPNEIVCW